MKLAEAYANAGKALLDLADAIENGATSAPDAPGAPSFEELPFEEPTTTSADWYRHEEETPKPAGSAAVCPAHGIEYRKGRYGAYCPSTSEDPKWSNDKGYCTVTPKSAAAWLRQHAA